MLYTLGYSLDKKSFPNSQYSLGTIDHLYALMWGILFFIVTIIISIYLQRFLLV